MAADLTPDQIPLDVNELLSGYAAQAQRAGVAEARLASALKIVANLQSQVQALQRQVEAPEDVDPDDASRPPESDL